MKTYVVIPSCRDLANLSQWSETDLNKYPIILVEDKKEKTIQHPDGYDIIHYTYKDIEDEMKENAWIISRGDSSIKSFGLLQAYKQGAEAVIFLDDDVSSQQPDFVDTHKKLLNANIVSNHNGILNMVRKQGLHDIPQKGLPKYYEKHKPCVFSYGLWYGYVDVPAHYIKDFGMPSGNAPQTIEEEISDTNYAAISGMNVAIKAEAFPAYYQLLQGPEYGLGKWGDTWSGLFLQKICHHLSKGLLVGHPMVFHQHFGDNNIAFEMERGGIELNELMWRDIPKMELYSKNFRQAYIEVAKKLPLYPGYEDYMTKLKSAMQIWADYF